MQLANPDPTGYAVPADRAAANPPPAAPRPAPFRASRASRASAYIEEGFPHAEVKYGIIAATTRGSVAVVAA